MIKYDRNIIENNQDIQITLFTSFNFNITENLNILVLLSLGM